MQGQNCTQWTDSLWAPSWSDRFLPLRALSTMRQQRDWAEPTSSGPSRQCSGEVTPSCRIRTDWGDCVGPPKLRNTVLVFLELMNQRNLQKPHHPAGFNCLKIAGHPKFQLGLVLDSDLSSSYSDDKSLTWRDWALVFNLRSMLRRAGLVIRHSRSKGLWVSADRKRPNLQKQTSRLSSPPSRCRLSCLKSIPLSNYV